MAAIGYVRKNEDGSYKGQLATLTLSSPIEFVPLKDKKNEKSPDFRIMAGRVELGAAWINANRTTSSEYVSAVFAAPEFGSKRLFANLGRAAGQDDEEVYAIIWNPED
jgi:uncharacterized protein (DUF736 family)